MPLEERRDIALLVDEGLPVGVLQLAGAAGAAPESVCPARLCLRHARAARRLVPVDARRVLLLLDQGL
eukprot:4425451-Lingulodinium_polyedra.AAC.1